jgi:large subunit ribosomal protein L9
MNIILLERVTNLGDLGEEVNVKNGFARNFLIPTGKAVRATEENSQVFENRRTELESVASSRLAEAEARASRLDDVVVNLVVRASEEGKLYGSIGTVEISRALSEQGVEISRTEVRMADGAIRSIGEYTVDIHIHADVTRTISVYVIAE